MMRPRRGLGWVCLVAPTLAIAEPLHVAGERAPPGSRPRAAFPWRLAWGGGPGRVEVRDSGSWQALADRAESPWTTPPLPPGAEVRVVLADANHTEVGPATFDGVWTPADVAAWSGPGLRGAVVRGLAATEVDLFAATDGGGLGWWDGARWRHVGERDGLRDDHLTDIALWGDTRAISHARGVSLIAPDGAITHLPLEGPVADLQAEGGRLYALADGAVLRWEDGQLSPSLRRSDCVALFADAEGRALASCGEGPDAGVFFAARGDPALPWTAHGPTRGAVPRADGAWLGTADALWTRLDGDLQPWWRAPEGVTLGPPVQLGGTLLVPARDAAHPRALGAYQVTEGGVRELRPPSGLPEAAGLVATRGPRRDQAWLGTTEGVALVGEGGQATRLPLAPLPAGIPARAARPTPDGVAVASDVGLVWIGPRAPRAWPALRAAIGPHAVAVLTEASGAWWGVGGAVAVRVDRGEITRFELGAEARSASPYGEGVAIHTAEGVRFWAPGATQLSPAQFPGASVVATGRDGALWAADGDGVTLYRAGATRTWTLPGVTSIQPDPGGAWVIAPDGAWRLQPSSDEPQPAPRPPAGGDGAPLAIGVTGGRLSWLDRSGALFTRDGDAWLRVELGTIRHAYGLVDDAGGAWVLTDQGPFFVDRR
jgi:hypothetical protein